LKDVLSSYSSEELIEINRLYGNAGFVTKKQRLAILTEENKIMVQSMECESERLYRKVA